jgi:hypothetical protein
VSSSREPTQWKIRGDRLVDETRHPMRAELRDGLQELWQASLDQRACLSERSAVAVLEGIMASQGASASKIGSHLAPKIRH